MGAEIVELPGSPGVPSAPDEVAKERLGIYTISGLRSLASARPHYRVEGMFLEQSVNLLIGDSGLGKTPWGIQAGLCIAGGVPFLGRKVIQGRVLYCDAESNVVELVRQIEDISRFLGIEIPADFEVWSPNWDQSIRDQDAYGGMLIQRVNPTSVVARRYLFALRGQREGFRYARASVLGCAEPHQVGAVSSTVAGVSSQVCIFDHQLRVFLPQISLASANAPTAVQ